MIVNIFIIFVAFGSTFSFANADAVQNCTKFQWRCRRDGACIDEDTKCNGIVDCADGSDETFVTCREYKCPYDEYRCMYGGCVSVLYICDGVKDCVDNSDELLPRCRGETDFQGCTINHHSNLFREFFKSRGQAIFSYINNPLEFSYGDCFNKEQRCKDGERPRNLGICNGVVDCKDGSDETLEKCIQRTCHKPNFRCAYGGCIPADAMCNGEKNCADGSDELEDLCTQKSRERNSCVLPQFPKNGYYTVLDKDVRAYPGLVLDSVQLNYSCHPGFKLVGGASAYCNKGRWSEAKAPMCISQCLLNKHPSVEYLCLPKDYEATGDARVCEELVEDGTTVRPRCRSPNYYYSGVLVNMHCVDGVWDHVAVCTPQCGLVTPVGKSLAIGGRLAKRGELPWHAGIYTKTTTPSMQMSGGSLISSNVIISAAHCFWDDFVKQLPAVEFAVAVGKRYRPWNDKQDVDEQKSDVREIKLPPRFQGADANYQEDIALVFTSVDFVFKPYVRPVCVDFDFNFERRQLQLGATGKVAGWGLTKVDDAEAAAGVLQVVELPFVPIQKCIDSIPPGFKEYITSDKICVGFINGTSRTVCRGDSGGGLTFLSRERGAERYFLRGIVSTAPTSEYECNDKVYTAFTQVTKHEAFIKENLLF